MIEIDKVSLFYGKHQALADISMRIGDGETIAILGANGAGKSSLLKAISGLTPISAGQITFEGRNISGLPAYKIVEEGIALVPEGRRLISSMTVMENLVLGSYARRARSHEKATLGHIFQLFPRLAERKTQIVRTMSGGEQQMVAIGRALMSKPRLLMLDEPSLGLAPKVVADVFDVLRLVASKTGLSIVLVEQNANEALSMADRACVISAGRMIAEGRAAELRNDPVIAQSYLGA